MNIYTWPSKLIASTTFLFLVVRFASAQTDTTKQEQKFLQRVPVDTSGQKLNMDATYNRPFLSMGKSPVSIGGYLEANTEYAQTDGISEGFTFQARRMTLFFSSTIGNRLSFLSEIEFENGTEEINIEFAALDVEFHPLANFRFGIIVNPIGAFNQNHDGPRWDFIDRPLEATTIIPSTLSNAGFGLHGKHVAGNWIMGYETYLTNGFDDKIISNEESRTSLAASAENIDRFTENNSGLPMFTGKLGAKNRKIGEFGISYMSGVYNKWKEDGVTIDEKRVVSVIAFDYSTSLLNDQLNLTGEVASVHVEVPDSYSQQFGDQQFGAYLDIVATLLHGRMIGWEKAKLNLGVRIEYVDYNVGTFRETGDNIADDIWAVVPSLAFRPVGSTVIRFNYRYEWQKDLFGNPPARTGVIQFGIATYF